ncbi:MAG: DUF5684 domain-containing protein [Dehalococcoidia bacterium]|nr:DUF5684 domain-containing protein [Dehalococcoidia bacterium]MDD5493784.1 DUF5684 domain-containing protein [Dehalococcoidia bacterium]
MDNYDAELLYGGMFFLWVVVALVCYIWMAICLQKIAQKTNTPNGWLAWIPIANIYLMCMIAQKEWWWLLLCLIPYVNIVIIIILWWKIAEIRGKPGWFALLMLVPIANLIIPGIIAFSD